MKGGEKKEVSYRENCIRFFRPGENGMTFKLLKGKRKKLSTKYSMPGKAVLQKRSYKVFPNKN